MMRFISHAQNFEDVMLWRALRHIERGFYIDVGANHPEIDSVSKAFYDRGWSGVNIEPVTMWFDMLKVKRGRDINLNVAAGSANGTLTIFEIPDTGLSTTSKAIAERHKRENGFDSVEKVVPVQRLADICEAHNVAEVHFMKIDVEGAERDVLAGMDFNYTRPWILVIEATLPTLQTANYEEWESILNEAGYQYVYFDGLNRFYVANEHYRLADSFKVPPNFFDDFGLSISCFFAKELSQGMRDAEAEARQARQLERRLKNLEAENNEVKCRVASAEALLHGIYRSTSWRITAPFRWFMSQARSAGNRLLSVRHITPNGLAKPTVKKLIIFMQRRPRLWMFVVKTCKAVGAYRVARAFYRRLAHGHIQSMRSATAHHSSGDAFSAPANLRLSAAEARVFNDLKSRIASVSRRVG